MKPWKRIEPTTVRKVGWRTIVSKNFIMTDGAHATFDTVGPEGQELAAVIGLTADNKVIIARQFRIGPEEVMDELPGGIVDAGEDRAVTARREFYEETGYEIGEMTYLGVSRKDAYMNATWHFYLATGCRKTGVQKLEIEEHIEVDLISIDALIENAKQGRMTDAVAVLMAYDQLCAIQAQES
jgi:ADP-ribose pyrophosphatase